MDKKTKLTSSPKRGRDTTVVNKTSVPQTQMEMPDAKNYNEGHPKKKNHQRILETFFDANSDGDGDFDNDDGGIGGDGGIAGGSGDNSQETNAERKQSADEGLTDLEDDMESEVSTLLAQLGFDFSGDSYNHSESPNMPLPKDGMSDANAHLERENREPNTDNYQETASDADEDVLDMITNILQDHSSSTATPYDSQAEENGEKVNYDKDNNNNGSVNDIYFVPLTSNITKDAEIVSENPSFNSSGDGFSQTNVNRNGSLIKHVNSTRDKTSNDLILNSSNESQVLVSNQVSEENSKPSLNQVEREPVNQIGHANKLLDLARNANSTIPALKQTDHQTMNEGFDGKPYSMKQSRPDKVLAISHETSELRQKSQGQNESSVESESRMKGSAEMSSGNDTEFVLNFQTSPTPSSQLLQSFPGAVSYNVKLTNEESPPGKRAKLRPANLTNMTANAFKQSGMAKNLNHPSTYSAMSMIENKKNLVLKKGQTMSQRIFEVGQAAIEAGKNMILAQESHVDKEKIYDIVGTRNVTSVGRYLITIGEELLSRGKTLSSKKIAPPKILSKNKGKPNSEMESKNITASASFSHKTKGNETDSRDEIKIVSKSHNSDSDTLQCRIGAVHDNASLRGKVRAGLFIPTGYVQDPTECGRRCCDNAKCDMALVVNDECYTVECFHWTLCQVVPHRGSLQFRSAIVSIKRWHHLHDSQTIVRHDLQNNTRPIHESKLNKSSSSIQNINFQNHYPPRLNQEEEAQRTLNTDDVNQSNQSKVPSTLRFKSESSAISTKNRNHYSQPKRPKARNVQRKELNCRSFGTNGTGNLNPGSWKLSGKTNSSSKCVDLCCSQNGCDLAFQVGEFCYSLACYKDNRGCNPLAIPVGLSYLRLKRREKSVSKPFDISKGNLTRSTDDVSKGTKVSKKNGILSTPIDERKYDPGILSPLPKGSSSQDNSKHTKKIHPQNLATNNDTKRSNVCDYTIKRDMFFRTGHNAGEFRRAKNANDVDTCSQECCNSTLCDVAYMVENICFLVKCKDANSCQPVSVEHVKYQSSVVLVPNRSGRQDSLNSKSKKGDGSNFSAISEGKKKLITNNDDSETNPIESKDQSKQKDFSNDLEAAGSKKSNTLENEDRKGTLSQSNDFDIVIDNDNDDDVIEDADDDIGTDIYDYATDGGGDDDDYYHRDVIDSKRHKDDNQTKNYRKPNTVLEHNLGTKSIPKSQHSNLVTLNNTEDSSNARKNQTSMFSTQASSVIHQTVSPENNTRMTSPVEDRISTSDNQVHGIPSTGNLENESVMDGNEEPYPSKHTPINVRPHDNGSQVDHSGKGVHESNDHEHLHTGDTISGKENQEFDDQGVGRQTSRYSGSSSSSDVYPQGKDRGSESHDDKVGINNNLKDDLGLVHPNKTPSSVTSVIAETTTKTNNFRHKGIPDVTSKVQVQNVLRRLRKEDDKSSELSLQPPILKDKDSNDETYVIYNDADNGDGFGSSSTSKHVRTSSVSRSVNNMLEKDAPDLQRNPFTSQTMGEVQNNTSEKSPNDGNSMKTTGVYINSMDRNKSLNKSSITERNVLHNFDAPKNKSEKNRRHVVLKNDTVLHRNHTEKTVERQISFLNNKTKEAKWSESITNQTSLRQRNSSDDTNPKTGKVNISNTAFHSNDEKKPLAKSNLRGKDYKGDKILKPKAQEESELRYGADENYPFENFPSNEERYSKKGGDQWPWEVIQLDNSFPELPPIDNVLQEKTGSGFMETSDSNNMKGDKVSNTGESTSSDSEAKNISYIRLHGSGPLNTSSGKPDAETSRKLMNPTLPYRNSSSLVASTSREQLHSSIKAVLKSYYAQAGENQVPGGTKIHNGSNIIPKEDKHALFHQISTDHLNPLHERGSKFHHFKEENTISSEKVTQKTNNTLHTNDISSSALHQKAVDDISYSKKNGDTAGSEDPYWILASGDDLKNDPMVSESSVSFPKNNRNTVVVNDDYFNPFTPFVTNGHKKVKNINYKINLNKQIVRAKNEEGDKIPGAKKYSGKKDNVAPTRKKPKNTKFAIVSNDSEQEEKSDKLKVSTLNKSTTENDVMKKKSNAAKNFASVTNGTSKDRNLINLSEVTGNGSWIHNVTSTSEGVNITLKEDHQGTGNLRERTYSKSADQDGTDNLHINRTRLNQTIVPQSSTVAVKLLPQYHTSNKSKKESGSSLGILKDIDELLAGAKNEDKHMYDFERNRTNIRGWTSAKGLGDTSSPRDHPEVYMTTLDGQKVKSNTSSFNKEKPSRNKFVKNENKSVVLDTMIKPNYTARHKSEKVKFGSSKSNSNFTEDKTREKLITSKPKQKTAINRAEDQSSALHVVKGNDSVSEYKAKNKSYGSLEENDINSFMKNNSHVLPVITNETKLWSKLGDATDKPIHDTKFEILSNKSGDNTDMKKIYSDVIPADTNRKSLWSKNSEGDIIPKNDEIKNANEISGKDIMEPDAPKMFDNSGFNHSKSGKELTKVEILDDGRFITDDEDETENKYTGKDLKLPLNGDDEVRKISQKKYTTNLHSMKEHDFNLNKSEESNIDKILPGEKTGSSKLEKLSYHHGRESDEVDSSKKGNRVLESHASEVNIPIETRNSNNIHPWALGVTEESQRKGKTGIEEIKGETVQSPVSKDKSKLWGRNEHGDEIPRPVENVIEPKSFGKEDKQTIMVTKNKSEMENDGGKDGESKIRKWAKGNQYSDSQVGESQVNLDTGENAKLWGRNEDGDAIPKPNRDWLSEDEIEDTVSKPVHHFRFPNEEREKEMDEKGDRRGSEEISQDGKDIPTTRNLWLSTDDIEDSRPTSDIAEKISRNINSDTHFEDDDNEFERNVIPSSKEDGERTSKKNENKIGEVFNILQFDLVIKRK